MISFRNRRATILPSTLTFAFLCHAGLASAQTPEGWPFDDKDTQNSASQQAPAQPPKSAVQLRLEELYKRDGRPLPSYMRSDGSQPANGQQAPQQRPAQPHYNTPAATQVAAPQPARVVVRPTTSQGSIPQQLSDYYASQGKSMPVSQPALSAAAPQQPYVAPAPAPQPGLFSRFQGFWKKDTPQAAPQTSIQPSGYAPMAVSTPSPYPQSAPAQFSTSQRQPTPVATQGQAPTPAAVAPAVVHKQPAPRRYVMTVDLGERAPIETQTPPASTHPAAPAVAASPAPQHRALPGVVQAPVKGSSPPDPSQLPASPVSASGVATVRDETPALDPKSESDADQKAGPYTGLKLQETNDGVTTPEPTKVTTANANEPAERPHHAPMPAVDAELSAKPIAQPKVAAHAAAPTHPAVEEPSGTIHLEDTAPAAPHPTTPSPAPKMFVERHPATQLPPSTDESSSQMHKIGERIGQHGMKGFCAVALREQRQLVDAVPIYSAIYQSKRYYFSSAEAQARFEEAPQKYAPVAGGSDVVVRTNSDQVVEGSLDFAVWYKDRLFLFNSPESVEAFSLNPLPYASPYLTRK